MILTKQEWLKYTPWLHSEDDNWLWENVTKLFDIKQPTDLQHRILSDADLFLTLMDLPPAAKPNHKAEMMDRAELEFGIRPSRRA